MAKGHKAPSAHSRAARRATSPSIDTDKSLKDARAPAGSVDQRPAILAAHHNGGVGKKTKRKSVMSTKARQRHEKAMERAEAIMERTAVKVQKSKASARVIESRKKTWDEINRETLAREDAAQKAKAKAGQQEEEESGDDVAGEEQEMQDAPALAVSKPSFPAEEEDEEIL